MRALAAGVLLVGCSSNGSGTQDPGVGVPFWLDDRGVDLGVGDDQGASPTCYREQTCDADGCVTRVLVANGRCVELCAKPVDSPAAVSSCRRLERCVYSPVRRVGLCLRPCKTDADCFADSTCELLDKLLVGLGGVCLGKATIEP